MNRGIETTRMWLGITWMERSKERGISKENTNEIKHVHQTEKKQLTLSGHIIS